METINLHFNNAIRLTNSAGYSKIGTVHFNGLTSNPGIPSYIQCSFNLDLTFYGNIYKAGKPYNARFFIYIKGNDATSPQVDLYYDGRDLLNIQNNTTYDMPTDLLQFVANYNSLDTSAARPQATVDIDIYLKSDSTIIPAFNAYNFTGDSSSVSFENNLLARRDIVSSLPTGNLTLTNNQYNIVNYRNFFTTRTTGNGFTSTELIYKTDPINRIISYFGRITLNSGFAVGGVLDYVTKFNTTKYTPLTELHFPVTVFYNITGNPIGHGDVKVTSSNTMIFVGYDRMDTQPITAISQISLTGVSWEY